MKKLLAIILCLVICLGLVGCGEAETASSDYMEVTDDRFVLLVDYNDCNLFMDKETKVVYVWVGHGCQAGFTVLLDAEGKPVILNK